MEARQWTTEEKLQVVLEGLEGASSISALCRRHGIGEATYYNWQKAFLEGARERLDENAAPREEGLDETERQIILLLQQDGRASFVDMARQIGVVEGTVRRKFTRLMADGLIRIVAVTDPFRVGVEAPVILCLRVAPGKVQAVADRLAALPGVRYIAGTAGEHDLVAECLFANRQELVQFYTEHLNQIDGVVGASTLLLLAIYKNSFAWGLPDSPGRPPQE